MATLSADDARQLAADFHELAVAIGHYRFDNWGQLSLALPVKTGKFGMDIVAPVV